MVGSVDLRYTHPWGSLWAGDSADALIGDSIIAVRVEAVGERLVVTSHRGDRLVVGDQPEPPVSSVVDNRTPGPQLPVTTMAIGDEVRVLVVDINCSVGRFHGRSVPHCPGLWRLRAPRAIGRQAAWLYQVASRLDFARAIVRRRSEEGSHGDERHDSGQCG